MKRDLDRLLADARRRGWVVTRTGGQHWRLRHDATGALLFTGSTPSCPRALSNLAANLRRAERMQETSNE